MQDPLKNPQTSLKAYRLFLSELSQNLSFARGVTEDPQNGKREEWNELARVAHMIKGGAGFFGLNELAGVAAELEGRLKEPLRQVLEHCDELSRLVAELEELHRKLPPPDGGL